MIAVIATKYGPPECRKALTPNGTYVTVGSTDIAKETTENLVFLTEVVAAENMKTVIDKCYPLEQIVEAHRYVDTGHKKGNVVITIEHNT